MKTPPWQNRKPVLETQDYVVVEDHYPVSEGHLLIVERFPIVGYTHYDWEQIGELIQRSRSYLKEKYQCDGFNVGFNDGSAAGQTVPFFHIHVISRYHGDVEDPRGGVRNVIPAKGNYLVDKKDGTS